MGRVQVTKAFESPEALQQCTQFLRQYAEDSDAHAACGVIPKGSIAFPQVTALQCVCIAPAKMSICKVTPTDQWLEVPAVVPASHPVQRCAVCWVLHDCQIVSPVSLQVWKSSGWQHGDEDGVFLQLESLRPLRRTIFIPLKSREAADLKDTWLLERLFR